jgi:hypothetical protein
MRKKACSGKIKVTNGNDLKMAKISKQLASMASGEQAITGANMMFNSGNKKKRKGRG